MTRRLILGAETRLTREQAAILSAFTGILCGEFTDLHEYAERILGRPVFTHEFAHLKDELKEASRADFMRIVNKDPK